MELKTIDYNLDQIKLEYLLDEDTQQIAMILLPGEKESCWKNRREWLEIPEMVRLGLDKRAWEVGSLVHLSFDRYPQGKGAGETLKYGDAVRSMRYKEQLCEETDNKRIITTILESDSGCGVKHIVEWKRGELGIAVRTVFLNHSDEKVCLEFLTSASLDNLTPFAFEDPVDRMVLHRFYAGWSLEGVHRQDYLEDLNLERSWMCAFPESEKFGSIGSYPVHRYFPTACVEDREEHVFWGIRLEAPSSWQMELSRDGDCCSFSAGIADVEFGSWSKQIGAGEAFESTRAYISVADDLNQVCRQLLDMQHDTATSIPESEKSMPVIYNDWCANYGEPTREKTLAYAERLKDTPAKYIVIDAGWTRSLEKSFGQGGNGDWEYSEEKFPGGLKKLSREINEKGMKLGIWFEPEVTTAGAKVYEKEYDHMHLKRNGCVINSGGDRTFWDFRQEETRAYLRHKVIDFLEENELSYLKIDYNASIGIGCDGAESLGEGLRQQIESVQDFFREAKDRMPQLVIENCASGGHRLESSFIDLTSMSCFSDASECRELPCVGANLQRLVQVEKLQMWAVINEHLSVQEIYYRLASVFLGRFCLSGDIEGLSDSNWMTVKNAMEFYDQVTTIIRDGVVNVYRSEKFNLHHPKGIQIVERTYRDKHLLVIHCFDKNAEYTYPLNGQGMVIEKYQGTGNYEVVIEGGLLKIKNINENEGMVLLLGESF